MNNSPDCVFLDDVENRLIPYFKSVEANVDLHDRQFAATIYSKIGVVIGRLDAIEPPHTRPIAPGEVRRPLDAELLRRKEAARATLQPLMMKAYQRTLVQ